MEAEIGRSNWSTMGWRGAERAHAGLGTEFARADRVGGARDQKCVQFPIPKLASTPPLNESLLSGKCTGVECEGGPHA